MLIKDLEIEFEEGLNVISGETGTGKSMTLSAVEFVMGKQGEFPEGTAVEIEIEKGDGPVILRREIRNGRSRYYLDGRGTSLRTVLDILEGEIAIQGQNEFMKVLKQDFQRRLLDRFGKHKALLEKVSESYRRYSKTLKEIQELRDLEEETKHKRDLWEFKVSEIESVGLSPDELEEIRAKAKALNSAEKVKKLILEALIYLHDSETSAYSSIGNAVRLLWKAKDLGSQVDGEIEALNNIKEQLYELAQSLREKDIELSQEEIDRVNEILFKVQRLEKKYGKPYKELVQEAKELKKLIKDSQEFELKLEELKSKLEEEKAKLLQACEELSRRREKTAKLLEREILEILRELNLERATLRVILERAGFSEYGWDKVRFLFSSYGMEPKPLEECASGGELSRLFLALSLIDPPTGTYIFDEVDTGVSGETSVKLAKLLKRVSRNMQVIVITHSAPICAAGDVNFLTLKEFLGDIPYIRVKKLSQEGKLQEVARLMGTKTENTLKGAVDLLRLVNT